MIYAGMFHYKVTDNKWKRFGDVIMTLWGFGITIYTMYVNIHSWVSPAVADRPTPDTCPS